MQRNISEMKEQHRDTHVQINEEEIKNKQQRQTTQLLKLKII